MTVVHAIAPPGGSFAVAGVLVVDAEVYEGWSSVYLLDYTTTEESMFTWEESRLLYAVFERFALYADAQLAPDLFPRPGYDYDRVDPIPRQLASRLVPVVVDLVTTILRVREAPPS